MKLNQNWVKKAYKKNSNNPNSVYGLRKSIDVQDFTPWVTFRLNSWRRRSPDFKYVGYTVRKDNAEYIGPLNLLAF